MKCLVCVLEFPTWELAKPWSFISGYSFVDALRVLGHDVEVAALNPFDLSPDWIIVPIGGVGTIPGVQKDAKPLRVRSRKS